MKLISEKSELLIMYLDFPKYYRSALYLEWDVIIKFNLSKKESGICTHKADCSPFHTENHFILVLKYVLYSSFSISQYSTYVNNFNGYYNHL